MYACGLGVTQVKKNSYSDPENILLNKTWKFQIMFCLKYFSFIYLLAEEHVSSAPYLHLNEKL